MSKDHENIGIFAATGDISSYLNNVDKAVEAAKENLRRAVEARQGVPMDYAQGFYAEHWHAETFNVDAAMKRINQIPLRYHSLISVA